MSISEEILHLNMKFRDVEYLSNYILYYMDSKL